jgi:tRNA-uridine 2-sulfurtransferase
MRRAMGVLLYSGGLDSLLAGRILQEQNVELIGLYCLLPYIPRDADPMDLPAVKLAEQIQLKLQFYRCDLEYTDMWRNPAHGYGKQVNPCIDCKIFFLRKAAELMGRTGADFVASGEVVGQRPMSQQKHMLIHLEKESGLHGKLLRPLSAKILKPTILEQEGLIDREKLYDISGRGRKAQMNLAERFGIKEYSSPAGGCFFTDPNYARKAADFLTHCSREAIEPEQLYLLTIGRHFRINDALKISVGRNETENDILVRYRPYGDALFTPDFKGPVVLATGEIHREDMYTICSIIARYGSPSGEENTVVIQKHDAADLSFTGCTPVDSALLDSMKI